MGEPNAGKSTLVNALVGRKVAGVSPKPQTTRRRILGVRTETGNQIVFVDTPGFTAARNLLGEMMSGGAVASAREADVILYVLDSAHPEETEGMKRLLGREEKHKLLVLSKIDLVPKETLLPIIDKFHKSGMFREIIPVSALKNDGVERLLVSVRAALPSGPAWYGDETGAPPDESMVQEIVQEKIFRRLHKEVPYGCGVLVEEAVREGGLIRVRARILVEKESHKPIVIGEKGQTLKKIGTDARLELEKILGSKVHLELWVKIEKGWRDRESRLADLGYAQQGTVMGRQKRGRIS